MRNYNNDGDGDNDVVPLILPTEGPIIVPLMVDQLRPRRGALFDILASDFSSDCKAKYDQFMGKRKKNSTPQIIPKRSEHYRRSRREFLCFIFCYFLLGLCTLFTTIFVLVLPVITGSKFRHQEHNVYGYYTLTEEDVMDDYVSENFKESFKRSFFGDAGFD